MKEWSTICSSFDFSCQENIKTGVCRIVDRNKQVYALTNDYIMKVQQNYNWLPLTSN